MSWLQSPLFVGLAILGFVMFLILGAAGRWTTRQKARKRGGSVQDESLLFREVPWYGFVAVYVGTIAVLLFVLIRFAG